MSCRTFGHNVQPMGSSLPTGLFACVSIIFVFTTVIITCVHCLQHCLFFFFFATEFLTVPIQMILLIKLSGFVERAKVLNNLALPPLSSSCILKIPFKLSIFILQLYRNAYFLFFFLIKRNNTAPSDRRARWPNPSFSSPTSMILWFIKQFMFLWAKSMGKIISSNQIKSSAPDENTFG